MAAEPVEAVSAVTLGGRDFQVLAQRPSIAAFWAHAAGGGWEDDTFRFVKKHVRPGCVFVDIGAWIGPIALAAWAQGAHVLALEPDPVARGELERNIALNGADVEVLAAAIDLEPGMLKLYAPSGLGESVTSSLADAGGVLVETPVVTFADIAARLPAGARVVVKMDIEGHEYRVLDALIAFARAAGAPLHLSVHPASIYADLRRTSGPLAARIETLRRTRALLARLEALGPMVMSVSGRPADAAAALRQVMLKRRPKNFTVETA